MSMFFQWLLIFYLYCIFGWVLESIYISMLRHKIINRGFLKGPFLPIYGFGAMVILFATNQFQNNIVAVFFAGAFGATILEYFTGAAMEQLFKVRYWDYTNNRFNLHGHICLFASTIWGVLSVLLTKVFQPAMLKLVLSIDTTVANVMIILITIVLFYDFVTSFKTALDLRDVLVKMDIIKIEIKHLQKRMNFIEAIIADEANRKTEQLRHHFNEELQEIKDKQRYYMSRLNKWLSIDKIKLLSRNPSATSSKYAELLEEIKKHLKL